MTKGYIDHKELGRVLVTINPRATRFIARWKGQELHLTSPAVAGSAPILQALDSMASRLLASRPEVYAISPGTRLDFDHFFITFTQHPLPLTIESRIMHHNGKPGVAIAIGKNIDPSEPSSEKLIAKHIHHAAHFFASSLIAEAQSISARLGVSPKEWVIGNGSRRLGCCGANRRISLSSMCMFLPYRLREYIVCHELAHLTHFDHSPTFHELCSRYCGGDGNLRRAELKAFRWPVPR